MNGRALPPGSTIGIVGGGQLGRMTAIAAARLGYRCHILSPEAGSPAIQVAAGSTVGAYTDEPTLRAFAAAVDVVTFEFENVDAAGLDILAALRPVRPSPGVLRISQDRVAEKSFLSAMGVATARWRALPSGEALERTVDEWGEAILKTTRLGYDGRGQRRVSSRAEACAAWEALKPHALVAEEVVDFACEVSVVVARGLDGRSVAFDVGENVHRHHILDLTFAPARIAEETADAAQRIALAVAERLDVIGVLAVEMFVDANGRVLVNEIAPRPHNSGHWTIDACQTSQFEMHARAVAGLPLPTAARHSDAVMKNLVGPGDTALWPEILATPGLIPHHYGKADARPGRKMGHVTRLFPRGALPGPFGIAAALGVLATPDRAETAKLEPS